VRLARSDSNELKLAISCKVNLIEN
jgi:hypothetical protein